MDQVHVGAGLSSKVVEFVSGNPVLHADYYFRDDGVYIDVLFIEDYIFVEVEGQVLDPKLNLVKIQWLLLPVPFDHEPDLTCFLERLEI